MYPYPHLLTTDYASMEGYCFNEEVLEKILLGYPSKQPQDYEVFLENLAEILSELFLIRFAKNKLHKGKKYIAFDDKKYLTFKNKILKLDRDKYLQNYFSNKKEIIDEIKLLIEDKKKSLPKDIRQIIHGHDFEDLLQFYLRIRRNDKERVFQKSLYSALEYETLRKEKLFQELLEKL